MRRTKIVATIGPATDRPEAMDSLVRAGVQVARINASHSDRAGLEQRLAAVRAAESRTGLRVAVMLDLAGPKIRIGEMAPDTLLEAGATFVIATESCVGDARHACVTDAVLAADVSSGDVLLLDDGRIRLRVRSVDSGTITTMVEVGGILGSRKGVNVPGVTLGVESVTPKDEADLAWGLDAGVDLVAQSFVRSATDVDHLRALMGDRAVPIVAKIEKHEALSDLEAIIQTANAVMVARGDLGVETSPEQVPVAQRRIIRRCRETGTPVIVATQMLESMVHAPAPTRAEASDVANAIFESADAVMLSGETAVGEYPVETVATMARIIQAAEADTITSEIPCGSGLPAGQPLELADVTRAVSAAVCEISANLELRAILTATRSGATALAVARHRPSVPIVAITPDETVARRLMVVWGVVPLAVPFVDSVEAMIQAASGSAKEAGIVETGDLVAFTAGVVFGEPGSTNLIQVHRV